MNKTAVALLVCCIFCAPAEKASAEDLTNPFYMPLKGKGVSETSFSYAHAKAQKALPLSMGGGYSGTSDDSVLEEALKFGVTDRFSVIGGVGNFFKASGDKDTLYWKVGGRYAFFFEETPEFLMQAQLTYMQMRGADKQIDASLLFGYDAGATVPPYAEVQISTPLDQGKENNESEYTLRLGGYSVVKEKTAVRAGLEAYFNHEAGHYQSYSVFAQGEYVLSPSMSVSVTAAYLLHDTFKFDAGVKTDSFSLGAGFKLAF